MKYAKNLMLGSTALMLLACNNVEIGFVPLYPVNPDVDIDPMTNVVTCSFNTTGTVMPFIRIDVFNQSAMSLSVIAANQLQEKNIELQAAGPNETLIIPNNIQPVRFDYRWECDTPGFASDQGPLFVPAFSTSRPFCLDQRNDATRAFVGFDTVSATGRNIAPQDIGIIQTRVIPPQLADGVRDSFELAILADRCCREVGGCNAANLATAAVNDPTTQCGMLQAVFNRIGGGQMLSAQQVEDVQRWRPFVAYTDANGTGNAPAAYNMRIRGRYEALTPTGALVTSTEFAQDIGFCANCPTSVANACLTR